MANTTVRESTIETKLKTIEQLISEVEKDMGRLTRSHDHVFHDLGRKMIHDRLEFAWRSFRSAIFVVRWSEELLLKGRGDV